MAKASSKFYKNIEKRASTPGCLLSKFTAQRKGDLVSEGLLRMWLPAEGQRDMSKRTCLNFITGI